MSDTVFVVTANRTDDGAVVYLSAERTWISSLQQSHRPADETERDDLLQWAHTQQREVCDPYLLKVRVEGEELSPLSVREVIRAAGPEAVLRRFGYVH